MASERANDAAFIKCNKKYSYLNYGQFRTPTIKLLITGICYFPNHNLEIFYSTKLTGFQGLKIIILHYSYHLHTNYILNKVEILNFLFYNEKHDVQAQPS